MSDAGNNPWAMWLAARAALTKIAEYDTDFTVGPAENVARLQAIAEEELSRVAWVPYKPTEEVMTAIKETLETELGRPTHCPTCGGVLADLRGSAFNVKQMKAAGVCALWSDNNYECARKR